MSNESCKHEWIHPDMQEKGGVHRLCILCGRVELQGKKSQGKKSQGTATTKNFHLEVGGKKVQPEQLTEPCWCDDAEFVNVLRWAVYVHALKKDETEVSVWEPRWCPVCKRRLKGTL